MINYNAVDNFNPYLHSFDFHSWWKETEQHLVEDKETHKGNNNEAFNFYIGISRPHLEDNNVLQ